jgi:uncharacterized damage-inducible protein DinB
MIKDALLPEFDREMAATRRLLERVPDGKLDWAPHPRSRTLGVLAAHLAQIPNWVGFILNDAFYDLAAGLPSSGAPASRAETVAAFDAAVGQARHSMDRLDAEYLVMWTLKRAGQEMFSLPRAAALRTFVFSHLIHHRGQLTVYLRLLDVPVPAIYGPTADEG